MKRSRGDLWEALGSLEEEESQHLLTRLFAFYEDQLERDIDVDEALKFFRNLDTVLTQVTECNLNRR